MIRNKEKKIKEIVLENERKDLFKIIIIMLCELILFREVTITKSNGTSRQFRLILSSGVPTGAIHMGKMEVRKNHQSSFFIR
jgi:hypothetical protein